MISEFIAITQASKTDAREYLQTAKWDVQAAVDFYFDSVTGEPEILPVVTQSKPFEPKISPIIPGRFLLIKAMIDFDFSFFPCVGIDPFKRIETHSSNDPTLRLTTEDSLRFKSPVKTPVAVPNKPNHYRSIISSNISTFDSVRRNQEDSDDEDNQGN